MDRKVEMYCPPMTSSGYSAAIYQFVESMEMDGNNLCASENTCHGKREIAFVDSENASPMNNTTVKATYIVSGDQMIGINLNLRAGTIPQSILTISSNAVGNIPGQFSANGVRLLPGIQRPPANDSHLVNQVQPDAASHRMSYGGFVYGQTSPTHLQLPTYANTGYEQPQQVQQASVNFSVPNHNATFPLLMDNGRIRYRNDQNQMIQLQRQNMMGDPVAYQIMLSRLYKTAMQPSNYPIIHIPEPLQYMHKQQDLIACRPTISCDDVQCGHHTWPPTQIQTTIVPNVIARLTLQSLSIQHQIEQSAHNWTSTSILDLNDDCLIEICRKLDEYDWYRLRVSHNRFVFATEYCYKKMDSEKLLEFNFSCWSGVHGIDDLVEILEHFGDCMTRARIDAYFTKFVKEKCISQSFLAERLKNVRFLRLYHVGHDDVEFLSILEHIQELELEGLYNWMPLHVRWPHLKQLNVIMYTPDPPTYEYAMRIDTNNMTGFVQLIAFLMEHRGLQKFSISVGLCMGDRDELCKIIVNHMSELIELDMGPIYIDYSIGKICTMSALRKLKISLHSFFDDFKCFEGLKNLKSLTLIQMTTHGGVCEILRRIPSLIHLEISTVDVSNIELPGNLDDPKLDCKLLEPFIEIRKMSPHCENELLCIYIARLRGMSLSIIYYPKPLKRCEKYVKISGWKEGRAPYRRLYWDDRTDMI